MHDFFQIIGDNNPLHNDVGFARSLNHPDRVVYGMLTASFLSTLAGVYLPGKYSLIHRVEVEFPMPVYIGDQLTVTGTVKNKNDVFHTLDLKVVIINQAGKKVCRGNMTVGVTQ